MSPRGLRCGLLGGLLLAALETLTRYLPAHTGTDLTPGALLPVMAGLFVAIPAGVLGLTHPGIAAAVVVVIGAVGGGMLGAGLGAVAAGLALGVSAHSRWSAVLGALLILSAVGLRSSPAQQCSAPVVALVVMDTVGASATSLHGAALPTTPALESLAQRGVWFSGATSTAPWTLPAHAAMFTGQLARDIGAHHEHLALPEGVVTLAQRLSEAGWRTGAFVANPWIGRETGMTRGFTHQEHHSEIGTAGGSFSALSLLPIQRNKGGRALVRRAVDWVGRCADQPTFVFLNLLEAHSPFHQNAEPGRFAVVDPQRISERMAMVQLRGPEAVPGFPEDGEIEAARRVYAAGVAEADVLVGALAEALPGAALVVTADHGEAFAEHGFFGHMIGIHSEVLSVPLVVVAPDLTPKHIPDPVSTARIHDTLLDLAGLPAPDSLLSGDLTVPVFSEQLRPVIKLADLGEGAPEWMNSRQSRVQVGASVLIARQPESGPIQWWYHEQDPTEIDARSLSEAPPALSDLLSDHLSRPIQGGPPVTLDGVMRARLHALGYVEP